MFRIHHVSIHLRSRLDSRYKSSGNAGRRKRERISNEEDPADCQQILDRCRVACANVRTKCWENPEAENQERRWADSRHTAINLHRNAYKCALVYTNTGVESAKRASGLDIREMSGMRIFKSEIQYDDLHIIFNYAFLKAEYTLAIRRKMQYFSFYICFPISNILSQICFD